MSSNDQQAQDEEQRSPLLDLPAELRLMVYEEHWGIVYRSVPLEPLYSRTELLDRGYWPSYTIPSGLATTNRQLFGELQAVLPIVRDMKAPDILLPFPIHGSQIPAVLDLVATNIPAGGATLVGDNARLTTTVEDFVAANIPIVTKQHATRQEKVRAIRKVQDDETACRDFVRLTRSRVQKTGVFHARLIIQYDDACRDYLELLRILRILRETAAMRLHGIQLKISVGTKNGFPQHFLDLMAATLFHKHYEQIDWVEASEEEDDLLYGESREGKYRGHNVIKQRRLAFFKRDDGDKGITKECFKW